MSRLREARKRRGLTQFELAKRTGIHPTDIGKVEAGIILKPFPGWRKRLAQALGLSEEELFGEVEHNGSDA